MKDPGTPARFGMMVLHRFSFSATLAILAFCAFFHSSSILAASILPAALQCEYLTEPIGIDVAKPRFTWRMIDSQGTRGQKQTAYHLLVASSRDLLDQDCGDVWDSGKIASSQSALIPFAGKPLQSNQICHWKVKIWDKEGAPSAWSSSTRFTVGLLRPEDWNGPWIKHPDLRGEAKLRALDVTENLASLVKGNELSIPVTQAGVSKAIDPAPNGHKKLIVSYTVDGKENTCAVLDGQSLKIISSRGNPISIKRALYGEVPYPVLDLTELTRQAVSANKLTLAIDRKVLTKGVDPAPGKNKHLRVEYEIGGQSHQITGAEGSTLQLPAPSDGSGLLTITSATFGDLAAPAPPATAISLGDLNLVGTEKHFWFRRNVSLEKRPVTAFIHVASIGYHELYINGKKADDRVLAPSLTRLDKRVLYVTYDIAGLLQAGANTIALWTGPGWARYAEFKVLPALRVQLNAKLENGDALTLSSDETWKCKVSSSKNTGRYAFGDYGGEKIDGRSEIADWNDTRYDDSKWKFAAETPVNVELCAHMLEPTRIIGKISPQHIEDKPNGAYRIDMGKNFTGSLQLKFRGQSAGDVIRIKVSDDLDTLQDFGQYHEYICNGTSGETFQNRFNYVAGRYILLEGLKTKPRSSDIAGLALSTDLERVGHFSCSNPLFNQIYETDLWTYIVNTTEGYTMDCPHRERLGYGEVALACSWGIGLPNYRVGALYTKNVRDWSDLQDEKGWINHTAPQVNNMWGGALWSSAGLNVAWEFYQTYGDVRMLEQNYPSSKRWLEFLNASVKEGVLNRYTGNNGKFLGDWAAPGQRKEFGNSPEAQYFNNCVYAMNLACFIRMADILGHSEDVALYGRRLKELRSNVHARFFNSGTNLYSTGHQVQQAFALLAEITPEPLRPAVAATIETDISQAHPYIDAGSSGLPILLKYVTEISGRSEMLSTPLSKTTEPSYGYFLKRGETAWPEYWNVDVTSRMHTCYTGIAGWFTKSVAGIRPDPMHPGFQAFLIQPTILDGLDFAEASTESLYGIVSSRWEKTHGKVTLKVTIPANSQASIYLPVADPSSITESGKPLGSSEGVTSVGIEGKHAVFVAGSGNYLFSFPLESNTRAN